MSPGYGRDLAWIHDDGFGDFARTSAPGLLRLIGETEPSSGLIVDLGCGSGVWAAAAGRAGYDVLGVDRSAAMIAIARARAPHARFRVVSLFDARLPPCCAVTAIGEVFSYLFDERHSMARIEAVWRRIYRALEPGGCFIFDVAAPGRGRGEARIYREARDWAILRELEEDRRARVLTRRITTFRKMGGAYRRAREVHRLRLFTRAELLAGLRHTGFRVRVLSAYGARTFEPGHIGFLARKVPRRG